MKLKFVAGIAGFFVLIAVVLSVVLFGPALLSGINGTNKEDGDVDASQGTATPNNVIANENAQLGTTSWQILPDRAASTEIQAYASALSVLPGQQLTFYVSTLKNGTAYSINIYRLGWYGGDGGRLMLAVPDQVGQAQGYYDLNTHRLVDCHSCHVDTFIGLIEANWQPSFTLTIPTDWVTGIYLAKFTNVSGLQTYAVFDVRGNVHSPYLAVTPDMTYAAYNSWGGYSLYTADSPIGLGKLTRGVKVSFDRPYLDGNGASQVLRLEVDAVHWLERQGYDISYMSDVDMQNGPAPLLQHRVYMSLGHDEYWTKEMRDDTEYARNHGVALAFLGANADYWQIRLESDTTGHANRTVVCYKVSTDTHDIRKDPIFGKDNTRVTTRWRDPFLARPENALIGIMYSSALTTKPINYRWQVSPQVKSALMDGTGLQPGQSYGCGLVGYEWDRAFNNGVSPAGLQILSISHTIDDYSYMDVSNTTYYIASSGAMVFATGSIYWTAALDDYRYLPNPLCAGQATVVPEMQKLMENVMKALVVKHTPGHVVLAPANTTDAAMVIASGLYLHVTVAFLAEQRPSFQQRLMRS